MKNILFIHQSAELYGSDRTLLLLLKHLDKTQFNPVVVLPFDGPLKKELEKNDIKVVIASVLKLYRKMFTPKNMLTFFSEVKKGVAILDDLNRHYKFDIIYSNTLAVLLGMIYAKKRKIKHIWHVHEIIVHPKPIAYIFPRLLNKYADIVVCNSKATQKNLIDRVDKIKNKSVVIYNAVENQILDTNNASKKEFGFDENDVIITLVGRISRLKGHKWLLNTYIKHIRSTQNVKLLFVGSPVPGQEYHLEEVESIIATNNLTNCVKILPFRQNLDAIWHITDIAVMPSTEAESFGLVAVEAMLAQKPAVGSNHGGLTEIIVNNETGFLVEPNNETALSEALSQLIENPQMRKNFGQKGYERAVKEFSVNHYVTSFENLFLNL